MWRMTGSGPPRQELVSLGGDRRDVGVDHLGQAGVRHGDAEELQPRGRLRIEELSHRRVETLLFIVASCWAGAGYGRLGSAPRLRRSDDRACPARRNSFLGSVYGLDSGEAKAHDAVPVLRPVRVAERRPGAARSAVPALAAEHPERGPISPRRIIYRRPPVVIGRVPVRTPLQDVAVHVEQPPGVRVIPSDRRRVDETVLRRDRPEPFRVLFLGRPVRDVSYRCQRLRIVAAGILASSSPPGRRIPTPPRSAGGTSSPPSGSATRRRPPRRSSSR